MDQSLNPITKSVFNDLLETQIHLREEAEERWQAARRFILEVTGYVASEWLFEKQTSGADLDRIPLETLIGVVREHIPRLIAQTASAPGQVADPDLRKKYQRLEEKFRQAEIRIASLQGENRTLADEARQRKAPPKAAETVALPDLSILPDFYVAWTREKFFEREAFALRLMGETGLARAPELKKAIIKQFEMSSSSGSAGGTLERLIEKGYITDNSTDGGLNGRPSDVIELTHFGQTVYLLLTGKKPAESEYALKKDHKTDAHTLLNLKAKDWLNKAGYEILEHAPVIQTANFVFNPDMVASRDGTTIYIEVERESNKGNQDRDAKWRNFFQFAGGQLYIFCENKKAQRAIIREVNAALGSNLKKANIQMCDLSKINDDFLAATGNIWTSARQDEGLHR